MRRLGTRTEIPGKLLLVLVVLLQLGFFLFVSRHHFTGGDEGFYLLASRLVLEGKVPYLDFFYTQAPLLPYIYGPWIKYFGISWISARTLSALLTTTLGVLLYVDVCQVTRKWIAGLVAVVLFMSSSLIYGSYPIAKTYSLAALCLYAAYVVVSRISASSSGWMIAVAGLLFGLSVSTRSYIVGVGPVFLWWLVRQSEARSRYARLIWFLTGFTIGIAPSLYLFVASPGVYLFNNLGYHALRSGSGLIGDWQAKIFVAAAVFAGSDTGLQFSIVSAVCLVAIFLPRMRRATSLLPFLVALVLGFISILPTPPFVEYFCMCMPFLIVAAVWVANDSFGILQSPAAKRIAGGTCVALFAMFVVMGVLRFQRYVTTKHNPLEDVTAVSNAIDQFADPREEVVAFWPGYIFASKADPYPGLESQAGPPVASKLTVEERKKYHLVSPVEIETDLAAHGPRIVVVEDSSAGSPVPPVSALIQHNRLGEINRKLQQTVSDLVFNGNSLLQMLPGDGYTFKRRIGNILIYTCCSKP